MSTILLEDSVFPAPNNIESFLINCYGSIKQGAIYNNKTCKYEDKY